MYIIYKKKKSRKKLNGYLTTDKMQNMKVTVTMVKLIIHKKAFDKNQEINIQTQFGDLTDLNIFMLKNTTKYKQVSLTIITIVKQLGNPLVFQPNPVQTGSIKCCF